MIEELLKGESDQFHKIVDGYDESGKVVISRHVSKEDWSTDEVLHNMRAHSLKMLVSKNEYGQLASVKLDTEQLLHLFRQYPYLNWSLTLPKWVDEFLYFNGFGYNILQWANEGNISYVQDMRRLAENSDLSYWGIRWLFCLPIDKAKSIIDVANMQKYLRHGYNAIIALHYIATGHNFKFRKSSEEIYWSEDWEYTDEQLWYLNELSREIQQIVNPEIPTIALEWLWEIKGSIFEGFGPQDLSVLNQYRPDIKAAFTLAYYPALALTYTQSVKCSYLANIQLKDMIRTICEYLGESYE